ncbi:hypothetical protein PGB90_002144 [Kerria lacca]
MCKMKQLYFKNSKVAIIFILAKCKKKGEVIKFHQIVRQFQSSFNRDIYAEK